MARPSQPLPARHAVSPPATAVGSGWGSACVSSGRMAHPGGPTLSALLLLLVAAGLHFGSATSINVSTPLNTVTSGRTTFADQTTQQNGITSPSTTSVPTSLPSHAPSVTSSLAEQATVTVFSTNTPEVKDSTVLTTNSSPQSSTGLESTEHTVAPTTSVASQTANTGHHTEVTTVTSPYINASSDISAVPTNITNISTIAVTQSPNTKTSTVTVITSKTRHPEDTTSVETPSAFTFLGPTEGHTSSPVTSASKVTPPVTSTSKVTPPVTSTSKVTPETSHTADATLSSGVTVQEVPRALSSGSIAAITIAVIAVVVLVFGIAAFLKIRHSSYGRLLDDHDYGSWGNYNNPLYDDS